MFVVCVPDYCLLTMSITVFEVDKIIGGGGGGKMICLPPPPPPGLTYLVCVFFLMSHCNDCLLFFVLSLILHTVLFMFFSSLSPMITALHMIICMLCVFICLLFNLISVLYTF